MFKNVIRSFAKLDKWAESITQNGKKYHENKDYNLIGTKKLLKKNFT